jgi:hypothetical protein
MAVAALTVKRYGEFAYSQKCKWAFKYLANTILLEIPLGIGVD